MSRAAALPILLAALATLAVGAEAPAAAQTTAEGGTGARDGECPREALWVLRVDGAAALPLQALTLADRLDGASPLRHRASRRLLLAGCPEEDALPGFPMPPGTRGRGLSVFAAGEAATNSAYPRGGNDGALWRGRGVSGLVRPGVAVGWRFFTASLAPEVVAWQNADFRHRGEEAEGRAAFRNPWHSTIDWPDRPGGEPRTDLLPGQSFVRVDLGPIAGGLSSANARFGPARHFPLLLGTAAPGFPHAFLGTSGPVRLGPIRVEAESFAGELRESAYFDGDPTNDRRALIGTYVGLSPFRGLWVGALRLYSEYVTDDQSLADVFRQKLIDVPWVEGDQNLPGNGLASAFVRWAPPGTGFELYGEYGREDYPYNLEDVAVEPDWTRTYNLGASKLFERASPVLVNVELANLGPSNPERSGKGWFSWYTHSSIRQGHTHRGELLGAWIGPGSTAQRLSVDVLTNDGLVGGYVQRVAYDEDVFYRRWSLRYGGVGHDVELTAAARTLRPLLGGALRAELSVSHRRNRGFIVFDQAGSTSSEWNVGLQVDLLYD